MEFLFALIFILKITYIVLTARNKELILNLTVALSLSLPKIYMLFSLNRSSCPEVFCKKGVLKHFAKFTGKHMCQSLFFNKVAVLKKETLAQLFSCEFCKIFRNTFFYRTPLVAAFDLSHILWWLSLYYNFYFALFCSTMSGNDLIRK